MKIHTAVLVAALAIAGCGFAQEPKKAVGYDLGSCSPSEFFAVHVDYTNGADITITEYSDAPDKVVKLEKPSVLKYIKTDKDGKHYLSAQSGQEVVVEKADEKVFVAKVVTADGDLVAVVFGIPADGTKLAENAKDEFGACMKLLEDDPDPNQSKT